MTSYSPLLGALTANHRIIMLPPHLRGIIKESSMEGEPWAFSVGGFTIAAIIAGFSFFLYKRGQFKNALRVFRPIGFNPSEVNQIERAAEEWNSKSHGKYHVQIDPNCTLDCCSTVRKVDSIATNPKAIGEVAVKPTSYDIQLVDGIDVRRNALHEFGHVFGKKHDNSGTVMASSFDNQPEHLTKRDVR